MWATIIAQLGEWMLSALFTILQKDYAAYVAQKQIAADQAAKQAALDAAKTAQEVDDAAKNSLNNL